MTEEFLSLPCPRAWFSYYRGQIGVFRHEGRGGGTSAPYIVRGEPSLARPHLLRSRAPEVKRNLRLITNGSDKGSPGVEWTLSSPTTREWSYEEYMLNRPGIAGELTT